MNIHEQAQILESVLENQIYFIYTKQQVTFSFHQAEFVNDHFSNELHKNLLMRKDFGLVSHLYLFYQRKSW